jgi:hypothetical protein
MLIEVAIRCSLHPAYAKHRDSYPYKLKARITYLREILSLDGPMERYERIGKAVIDRLIKTEKQRNRLAHCAMEAHGNWGIKLHGFEPKDGSEILRWEERVSQEEFCAAAHKAALFSRVVMSLMHRLNDQELLPPLSGAE